MPHSRRLPLPNGTQHGEPGGKLASRESNSNPPIVPHTLRRDHREQQIAAIKKEVKAAFARHIRAATTKDAKRGLEAERDAEITTQIEPLIHDQSADARECL